MENDLTETPENHTVRLLQEMRKDMQDMRAEVHQMREDLTTRIDGNTLILNMLAGFVHSHEERISAIEVKSKS